jgi:adenylate kinase
MTSARLLIVGPQGSGKGTQGARISASFGIPEVSTGDVFRANIKEQTELGRRVKAIIDAGDLVPDELTGAVVRDRLAQPDAANGFLLDGYPRNAAQVADLDRFLDEHDQALDVVLELAVPRAISIERIALRAQEQGRSDDTEEVIAHRLSIYERETAPILGIYRDRGIVAVIDGVGDLDEVEARINAALAERGIERVAAL